MGNSTALVIIDLLDVIIRLCGPSEDGLSNLIRNGCVNLKKEIKEYL
jgi:hypothetical protein